MGALWSPSVSFLNNLQIMTNETASVDKLEGSAQEIENAQLSPDISMQPGLPAHLNTPAYRRGMRKVDLYVTGVVLLLYLFAFLDKANLGNARVEGLQRVSDELLPIRRSPLRGGARRADRPMRMHYFGVSFSALPRLWTLSNSADGFPQDLNMSSTQWSLVLTALYPPYMAAEVRAISSRRLSREQPADLRLNLQIPVNLMLKRIGGTCTSSATDKLTRSPFHICRPSHPPPGAHSLLRTRLHIPRVRHVLRGTSSMSCYPRTERGRLASW